MKLRYLIQTKEDFELVCNYLKEEAIVGIDTETNGTFSQYKLSLVGISIGFDLFAVYIPLTHLEGDQLSLPYVLDRLKVFLEDPESCYVFHNAKFDTKVFKIYGIDCRGSCDDTFPLSWLLDEEGAHGLKDLTFRYLRVRMETYEEVVNKQPKKRGVDRDHNFAKVSLEDALSYASDDAYFTLKLYVIFRTLAKNQSVWQAYLNIERPIQTVVRDMEYEGILVDQDYLTKAAEHYPRIMDGLAEDIMETAGKPFNIDSGQQLGCVLFEDLGIDSDPILTPSGKYKTDKEILERYDNHEIVAKVLHRKKVKKTYDVFVAGLSKFIEHDRVHANFHPNGTVTGRFSSSKPNMQQLQGDEIEEIRVRDFFVPAPGNIFVVGDFGQIELRVMAHFAQDEVAIAAFKSGRDFHSETARAMFAIASNLEPTTRQRFYAKALNFGIPYGRGPASVGKVLKIKFCCCGSTDKDPEGKIIHRSGCWSSSCGDCSVCYIAKWFEGFPQVGPYKDQFIKEARKRGYMRTIAGRKRRLPYLSSSNKKLRYGAERQAFNTLCQGSAADIIKLGMVRSDPYLKSLRSQILLQIHDELLVQAPISKAEKVVEVLHEVMENPLEGKNPLRLPLKFEPKVVERWSQAK